MAKQDNNEYFTDSIEQRVTERSEERELTRILSKLTEKLEVQSKIMENLSNRLGILEQKSSTTNESNLMNESMKKSALSSTSKMADMETTTGAKNSSDQIMNESVKCNLIQNLFKEIPYCDGKNAKLLIAFIIEIDKLHQLSLVAESEFCVLILTRVSGFLATWFLQKMSTLGTWIELKPMILYEILSPVHIEILKNEMCLRYQSDSETLLEFAQSIDTVARALNLNWSEESIIQTVMSRISSKSYYYLRSNPSDIKYFSQLTQISSEIEGAIMRDRLSHNNIYQNKNYTTTTESSHFYTPIRNRQQYVDFRSPTMNTQQHAHNYFQTTQQQPRSYGNRPEAIANTFPKNNNYKVNFGERGPRCFECNKYGHLAKDCEQRKRRVASEFHSSGNARRE